MLTSILLTLAALGWLTSVLGAVLAYHGAVKVSDGDSNGTISLKASQSKSKFGFILTVVGASAGGLCTVVAVLSSS